MGAGRGSACALGDPGACKAGGTVAVPELDSFYSWNQGQDHLEWWWGGEY